jgi:hypothetical protein
MVITRVNAFSVAKVAAVLYAGIGLLIGALFSLIGMIGVGAALAGNEGAGFVRALFGMGAIIVMPICYAGIGFIFSFIAASLFNVAAGMTGGVEIETRQP